MTDNTTIRDTGLTRASTAVTTEDAQVVVSAVETAVVMSSGLPIPAAVVRMVDRKEASAVAGVGTQQSQCPPPSVPPIALQTRGMSVDGTVTWQPNPVAPVPAGVPLSRHVAIIIEPRCYTILPKVLCNFLELLLPAEDWSLQVYHSEHNQHLLLKHPTIRSAIQCGKIALMLLSRDNLTVQQYDCMWLSVDFWACARCTDKVLMFQIDTGLFPKPQLPLTVYTANYDYIGAPWHQRVAVCAFYTLDPSTIRHSTLATDNTGVEDDLVAANWVQKVHQKKASGASGTTSSPALEPIKEQEEGDSLTTAVASSTSAVPDTTTPFTCPSANPLGRTVAASNVLYCGFDDIPTPQHELEVSDALLQQLAHTLQVPVTSIHNFRVHYASVGNGGLALCNKAKVHHALLHHYRILPVSPRDGISYTDKYKHLAYVQSSYTEYLKLMKEALVLSNKQTAAALVLPTPKANPKPKFKATHQPRSPRGTASGVVTQVGADPGVVDVIESSASDGLDERIDTAPALAKLTDANYYVYPPADTVLSCIALDTYMDPAPAAGGSCSSGQTPVASLASAVALTCEAGGKNPASSTVITNTDYLRGPYKHRGSCPYCAMQLCTDKTVAASFSIEMWHNLRQTGTPVGYHKVWHYHPTKVLEILRTLGPATLAQQCDTYYASRIVRKFRSDINFEQTPAYNADCPWQASNHQDLHYIQDLAIFQHGVCSVCGTTGQLRYVNTVCAFHHTLSYHHMDIVQCGKCSKYIGVMVKGSALFKTL